MMSLLASSVVAAAAPLPGSYAVIGVPAGLLGLWAGWKGFHRGTWGVERRRGFPGVCSFVAMVFGPGVAVVCLTGAISEGAWLDVGRPVGLVVLVVCAVYNILYFAGLVPDALLPQLQRATPRHRSSPPVDASPRTQMPRPSGWDRSSDGDLPDDE